MRPLPTLLFVLCPLLSGWSQSPSPMADVIRENAPVIAITHVTLIDGTGAPARTDQSVVIREGKIEAVGANEKVTLPAGAKVIDGTGHTLIPGLVGMHEHLFYPGPTMRAPIFVELPSSFPRLYLASGVTTARTTGSVEPYTDMELKRDVDAGRVPGPKLELTGPYLEGAPSSFQQMHGLSGADEAREFVQYWHSAGFTSVKAYMNVTQEELRAAIEEAHKLGMKVTGHLCSVSFREAATMGIDNLEHGPFGAPDSDLYSKRKPGSCSEVWQDMVKDSAEHVDPEGPELQETIRLLIAHHVAITSTLAVFEGGTRPPIAREYGSRSYLLMSPASWSYVMTSRAPETTVDAQVQAILKKEMQFEHAFVKAGGTLLAGCDPTGDGHVLAGLGDQRELELLVEAGFSVPEAVKIYTMNGAVFLGEDQHIGTIVVGKQADLVLLKGDLDKDVMAIEHPEVVFKDGVGFDSEKIYQSIRGEVGVR
jgi:imidazolonepropionase-like amidohydrolase